MIHWISTNVMNEFVELTAKMFEIIRKIKKKNFK